jgi:hypothetical protein
VAAALIAGLGVAAAMADDADGDAKTTPAKSGLWSSWLGEKPKPKAKTTKKPPAEERPLPRPAEPAGTEQQREMNAVLRRMEVCDRLRTIALQTGNDELMRQAEELEARAQEIYRRHTANPPAAAPVEEDTQPVEKKPAPKRKSDKALGESPRSSKWSSLGDRKDRMGIDFEMRERDVLKDVDTGRDRP